MSSFKPLEQSKKHLDFNKNPVQKWCATRQVDNEKNIKFLCCPVCAGQYFMQLITVHEIQTVLIHQDTFAGGYLCNSLYMPLSLVQVLLWYDTSFHNTFRVLVSPPESLHRSVIRTVCYSGHTLCHSRVY